VIFPGVVRPDGQKKAAGGQENAKKEAKKDEILAKKSKKWKKFHFETIKFQKHLLYLRFPN
jgi:hypothetical protein